MQAARRFGPILLRACFFWRLSTGRGYQRPLSLFPPYLKALPSSNYPSLEAC